MQDYSSWFLHYTCCILRSALDSRLYCWPIDIAIIMIAEYQFVHEATATQSPTFVVRFEQPAVGMGLEMFTLYIAKIQKYDFKKI